MFIKNNLDLVSSIQRVLEVSTGHVPRKTSIALGENPESKESAELFNVLSYVFWHTYGWIIICTKESEDVLAQTHPELSALIGLCVSRDIGYLKLDGDAPSIAGLPVFNW